MIQYSCVPSSSVPSSSVSSSDNCKDDDASFLVFCQEQDLYFLGYIEEINQPGTKAYFEAWGDILNGVGQMKR